MTKSTNRKQPVGRPLSAKELASVMGGEKKALMIDFEWQPESTTFSKTSGK
jgi:hypothetical protein